MIKLREDYQIPFVDEFNNLLATQPPKAYLRTLAPGGGKTVEFTRIIKDQVSLNSSPVLAVVHRRELICQISLTLARWEVKHNIIAPSATVRLIRKYHLSEFNKSYIDDHAHVSIASVQTLTSKRIQNDARTQGMLKRVKFAVFDEGHHYIDKSMWGAAVHAVEQAHQLFVTGCPERSDGIGLGRKDGGFIDQAIYGPQCGWLIDNGYLTPFKYFAPKTDLNLIDLKIKSDGDFNMQALRERVVESHLVGDALNHYNTFASGKKAIIFAPDVATSDELAERFGQCACSLSGKTDDAIRQKADIDFRSGDLNVLTNVDLFDEGYDVPSAECTILCRPTWSLNKFLQMCGRVLRPVYAPGYDLSTVEGRKAAIAASHKPHAIIIDMVRNWERLGMPNWERSWNLKGRDKAARNNDNSMPPMTFCTACTQPFEAFYKCCPYCGHVREYAQRSMPEQVEGSLEELNVEALANLMNKIAIANCSDEEHAERQAVKHMPMIARPRDLRRHKEAKERRKVLDHLIKWWVGLAPDRPREEVQRRFFHRFGVDIGTAYTLNAAKTDELIETIRNNFTTDM